MKLVVLGWDALDEHHIDRFGHGDTFGAHTKRIGTFVNPHIDAPHTRELWPSMITGCHPDTHGVWAATGDDGVDWGNPVLNAASTAANGLVPQSLLTKIGAHLRERGVGLSDTPASYYEERGTPTVFDDVGGCGISIPNHETDRDRRLGFDANRDSLWAAIDADKTSAEHAVRPRVDRDVVAIELGSRVGARLGATDAAIESGASLVWTWFGLLDSVGHMAPALGDDLTERWYGVAANITDSIREQTDDDTVVLSISDHGIRGGEHTEYATIACDRRDIVEDIDHVFDVADVIRGLPLAATAAPDVQDEAMEQVHDELEALGYIDA
jgi:hypothetical protein